MELEDVFEYSTEEDMQSDLPEAVTLDKFIVAFDICGLVIGVIGNITACLVILCSKSMRSLTDMYLFSLSTSDLLILVTGVIYDVYRFYYPYDPDPSEGYFSRLMYYYVRSWLLQTAVEASEYVVLAFTLERYLAICHPFVVQKMDNASRVKKIIASIWVIAATITFIPVSGVYYVDHSSPDAHLHQVLVDIFPHYIQVTVVTYFIIPMFLIILMYVLIGLKLHKAAKERITSSQADRSNAKTLAMFIVIVVVFFISWAPYYASELIAINGEALGLSDRTTFGLELVQRTFYSFSSAVNPVIYMVMSQKFRKAFNELLFKSRKKTVGRTFSTTTNARTTTIPLEISA